MGAPFSQQGGLSRDRAGGRNRVCGVDRVSLSGSFRRAVEAMTRANIVWTIGKGERR